MGEAGTPKRRKARLVREQLLPGRFERVDPEAAVNEIRGAVMRFLLTAGELHPNPAYSGGTQGTEDPK